MNFEPLQTFRQEIHQLLTKAKDATFELMDAVMTTRHASSLAEFSLSPMFRRRYPSTYEALEDSRPQRNQSMKLLISKIPIQKYITLAIDHTPWPRPEAKTLKDRTYEHQGKTKNGIVIGHGYSTIAWLPENESSWALPLRHERITSWESPIGKAAWQLKQVLKHCTQKVLVLLDREYGNAKWVLAIAELSVECVMRIRTNSCLYGIPPIYSGRGRPPKHGKKFKLTDPLSWTEPKSLLELSDPICGQVRVKMWTGLHFYGAAGNSLNLILIERLEPTASGRMMPPLWLVWMGDCTMPLEEIWNQYLRRFGIEHWYRFAKQRLHWTMPSLKTPEQGERWSDLMPLMTWQLWLAKDLVTQYHLPWQSATVKLSPGRVAQSMLALLIDIGTPAEPPKSRGKSNGRANGFKCTPRTRYPVARKTYSRPKKDKTDKKDKPVVVV
jgi:DDE superfamily endonuclease